MTTNNDTLLIIANGPSALKNKLGHEIDKFDAVGRINNYTINYSDIFYLIKLIFTISVISVSSINIFT